VLTPYAMRELFSSSDLAHELLSSFISACSPTMNVNDFMHNDPATVGDDWLLSDEVDSCERREITTFMNRIGLRSAG
jgi:hypothetical protein